MSIIDNDNISINYNQKLVPRSTITTTAISTSRLIYL